MNKTIALNMLNDVIEHFSSNPLELRSVGEFDSCKYNPPIYKPKSIGCAIGMYISTNKAKCLDNYGSIENIFENEQLSILLPKWMRELGDEFLQDVQNLHDIQDYWNNTGLTKEGRNFVKQIKKEYKLN